jgi:EAL domain-containing protein (putative c-di-GMP-specific phosphodiesterase class I)
MIERANEIIAKMEALKSIGIGFSLDDFGTGFSSLSQLKRLPLDQLKIDQSFVRDVLNGVKDASIVRAIIALGRSLNLLVIAEGVETEEQRKFLEGLGCFAFQGYLFSPALSAPLFENFVKETHRLKDRPLPENGILFPGQPCGDYGLESASIEAEGLAGSWTVGNAVVRAPTIT